MHIAIGDGIGAGLPWTEYAVLVPVTGMISALPISFGGWGVGEAASIYFFGLRGVAEQSALLISLGGRTLQLGWSLLGLPLSLVLPRPRELARAVEGEPVLEESQSPAAGTAGEG